MMEKQLTYHEQLEEEFGTVHIWRMDNQSELYVSQGKKCLGNVIAIVEDVFGEPKASRVNRPLTQKEMQEITDFFSYQAEPHDIDHFKKDVFNVEGQDFFSGVEE